jgi:sulfite exporter TauE/SafE
MCGPIALALPIYDKPIQQRLYFGLSYNIGRLIAYSIIGVVFGSIGQQFFIGGYQQFLSVLLGVIILLMVFFSRLFESDKFTLFSFSAYLKSALVVLFKSDKTIVTYLAIGFLNGLLPCGLVYVAIAGATATGSLVNGALFMSGFGLGTFPVLFALIYFGKFISLSVRNRIRSAVPAMVVLMALFMILRGLNLGIPYLSPSLVQTSTGVHSCCHKN